jgi:succinate dehydrogenase flavin-adding protein (antitoxin of CptAB toxin-antitoxin module)
MTARDPAVDRIRWHCRRGMLEIDLVLNAFLDQRLERLTPPQLWAFRALLERPDPQLLDFIMGADEPEAEAEREIVALLRAVKPSGTQSYSLTPGPSPEGRGEISRENG